MDFAGLMRVMLEDESLVSIYASQDGLCSALKKVLLGRDQMLQIAAAQCLVSIIAKSRTHMEMFLDKDMAGTWCCRGSHPHKTCRLDEI